jgi:hypothetical protein
METMNLTSLKNEIKRHFGKRAVIPDTFTIQTETAISIWGEELERVRNDELDYYAEFEDTKIPLITNDVYAAAYKRNKRDGTFQIIDSYMDCEDFTIEFLKININHKQDFIILDVYGNMTHLDKYKTESYEIPKTYIVQKSKFKSTDDWT